MIEWFDLEGTLKVIEFQPPAMGREHFLVEQAGKNFIQYGLEYFQGS